MASKNIRNGFWANKKNQKKAIGELLRAEGLDDPFIAGNKLTLGMIDKTPCCNIRLHVSSKYEILRIYFGREIKPWMVRKHGGKIDWTRRDIVQCLNYVMSQTGRDINNITVKQIERLGFHRLLFDHKHDFNKIKNIYSGNNQMPWEHRQVPRRFWKDTNNKSKAVRWLVDEKLKLPPKKVPELITDDDFVRYGLATISIGTTIAELVMDAYPERMYGVKDFRNANIRAILGYAFENVVYRCLDEGLKIKYNKHPTFKGCSHHVKCRPDISELHLPGVCKELDVVDIKLYSHTFFKSNSDRYLDHFKNMVLIYLNGNIPKIHDPRLSFINIDIIISKIENDEIRQQIELEVECLRKGQFPKRLLLYEKAARQKFVDSKCLLIATGKCSVEQSTGREGLVYAPAFGLCNKHLHQFKTGKIDITGLQLKPLDERQKLNEYQIEFITDYYKILSNQELAEHIWGNNDRKSGSRMNLILSRLGLARTKEEIGKVRGQVLIYDEKTLEILKDNWKKTTLGELCDLLKLENIQRNRCRIAEALLRFKIRPKSKPYTKQELIIKLKLFAKKLKRTPVPKDLDRNPKMPGKGTYIKYFGSWAKAKTVAGI